MIEISCTCSFASSDLAFHLDNLQIYWLCFIQTDSSVNERRLSVMSMKFSFVCLFLLVAACQGKSVMSTSFQRVYVLVRKSSWRHNRDFTIQRRRRQREHQKNNNRFNRQNNNFARASHYFVHFFPVFARLRRENA